jgi:4,5-dihydroxyphthalate decarboxylase
MRDVPTLLGTYPHTRPLKSGDVVGRRVGFDWVEISPVHEGFDGMIRRQCFDVSELAIGAFLQAFCAGSSIRLLPVVTLGDFHHASIFHDRSRGPLAPEQLPGRRVAVRSYSQTTGLWVRDVLREEYGISTADVTWVITEPSHVEGFSDPDNVEPAPQGADVAGLLTSGMVDAAILGAGRGGDDIVPLIPDAAAAARHWHARHGFVPINHMVAVSGGLAAEPELVGDVVASLAEAARRAPERSAAAGASLPEIMACLEHAAHAAAEQGLIDVIPEVGALFAPGAGVGTVARPEATRG